MNTARQSFDPLLHNPFAFPDLQLIEKGVEEDYTSDKIVKENGIPKEDTIDLAGIAHLRR